jgi:hypothetical protein
MDQGGMSLLGKVRRKILKCIAMCIAIARNPCKRITFDLSIVPWFGMHKKRLSIRAIRLILPVEQNAEIFVWIWMLVTTRWMLMLMVDVNVAGVTLYQCGTVTVFESAVAKSSFGGASTLAATLLASIS